MIKRIEELNNFKRGDKDIQAIYRGQTLIWPDTPLPRYKGYFNGEFTSYKGVTHNRIVKIDNNGNVDTSFNVGVGFTPTSPLPGATTSSYRTIVGPDGKIYVVGLFTQFNLQPALRIVRLFENGTRDFTFDTAVAVDGVALGARDVAFDNEGRIYVGGAIFSYKGTTGLRGLIRVNDDASLDTTFTPDINLISQNGAYGAWGLDFRNGNILVAMDGSSIPVGYNLKYININTGSVVREFNTLDLVVRKVINIRGQVYACGSFTIDTSFGTHIRFIKVDNAPAPGFNALVTSFVIDENGKIVLVGSFTTVGGISYNRIVRLNSDLSIDTSFNIGTGFNGTVFNVT